MSTTQEDGLVSHLFHHRRCVHSSGPQTVGDTAHVLGDLELRGANMSKTSGTYCGFVDTAVNSNCTMADVTTASPYTWRS